MTWIILDILGKFTFRLKKYKRTCTFIEAKRTINYKVN